MIPQHPYKGFLSLEGFFLSYFLTCTVCSVHQRHSNFCHFLHRPLKCCWAFFYHSQLSSFFSFCVGVSPCFSAYSLQTDLHFVSQNGHRTLNAESIKNRNGSVLKALLCFTSPSIVFALPQSMTLLSHTKLKINFNTRFFPSELPSMWKFPNPYFCTLLFSLKCSFLSLLHIFYFSSLKSVWILLLWYWLIQ